MKRLEIINTFIVQRGYKSYLEIGTSDPMNTFNYVMCKDKIGVDPNVDAPHVIKETSDQFFAHCDRKWDLIFVDGDHHFDQAKRDILNAIEHTKPGGLVLVHDCHPRDPAWNVPEHPGPHYHGAWCGMVKQAFLEATFEHPEWTWYIIDTGMGVGVIEVVK